MTGSQEISGLAAGVPFVAVPPRGAAGPAPLIVLWHLMGAPGSPAAMASALPLDDVPAWRVYLELPGTGSRASVPDRERLVEWFTSTVGQAVDELPLAVDALRRELPIAPGPVGLVGGSAGGWAALLALLHRRLPIAAAVLVNPAVRAESVVAVNERAGGFRHPWTPADRAGAPSLDGLRLLDADGAPETAVLILTGEHEYPEFVPDQEALYRGLLNRPDGPRRAERQTLPGLAHMFAPEPGDQPHPQTPEARRIDAAIAVWMGRHLLSDSG
ncbi:MAG TPA: alpha/beta fold hydrolase [Candidatus Dormibacteraeota bacterium]|jgi:pimeloyl-ACP methyl ester carboxylesterase|nr:alpha/beta fold hydrolase [Candidatus Dormibacteraeota bacterium]